ERPRRGEHAIRPPESETLRLNRVRVEAVEEFVDDRLQTTLRPFRQDLLAQSDALLARDAHRFGAARRERIPPGIPDDRLVERLQVARDRFVVDELVDR